MCMCYVVPTGFIVVLSYTFMTMTNLSRQLMYSQCASSSVLVCFILVSISITVPCPLSLVPQQSSKFATLVGVGSRARRVSRRRVHVTHTWGAATLPVSKFPHATRRSSEILSFSGSRCPLQIVLSTKFFLAPVSLLLIVNSTPLRVFISRPLPLTRPPLVHRGKRW